MYRENVIHDFHAPMSHNYMSKAKKSLLVKGQDATMLLTLHGRPLMTMKPFFLTAPAVFGYVVDAPASVLSNVYAVIVQRKDM